MVLAGVDRFSVRPVPETATTCRVCVRAHFAENPDDASERRAIHMQAMRRLGLSESTIKNVGANLRPLLGRCTSSGLQTQRVLSLLGRRMIQTPMADR